MYRLKILNILLALAAFPLMGLLARDYLVLKHTPREKAPAMAEPAALPGDPALEEYSVVLEKNVYPGSLGRLTEIDIGAPGNAFSAPVPPDMKLLGVYAGAKSYAVFEKAGASAQEVVMVGDTVFGAGVLISVSPRKAVVSTGSGEAVFTLFPEDIPEGFPVSGRESAVEAPRSPRPDGRTHAKQVSDSAWVLDQKAVESAVGDMGRVMTDARLTPRVAGGGMQGFLVTEIKPRGIFDSIGLKDGDVLTHINGYEIDSPEKAVQVLSAIKGQTAIDLDIIRQGQPRSFHYSIR